MNLHDSPSSPDWLGWFKLGVLWLAGLVGDTLDDITLAHAVLAGTLILTCLQVYKTRLEIRAIKERERRAAAPTQIAERDDA